MYVIQACFNVYFVSSRLLNCLYWCCINRIRLCHNGVVFNVYFFVFHTLVRIEDDDLPFETASVTITLRVKSRLQFVK